MVVMKKVSREGIVKSLGKGEEGYSSQTLMTRGIEDIATISVMIREITYLAFPPRPSKLHACNAIKETR